MLSLQLNIDWVSILGLILLPILMLIHTLLQMAINIGLGPLNCLISLLTYFYQLNVALEATLVSAMDAVDTTVNSAKEIGSDVANLGAPKGLLDNNGLPLDDGGQDMKTPEPKATIPVPPAGGYRKYQEFLGKLNAFNSLLIGMTDIKFTLEEMLSKFTRAIETIINLLSQGLLLKMQLAGAMTDIIRLIGFIIALIKGLGDKSICKDPTQPLSPADVNSIITILNTNSSMSDGTEKSLVSSTVGLDFDTATGNLVIENKITDQSKVVPTCLNVTSDKDRELLNTWISELEQKS
jgi:hypothetical protein